MNLDLYNKVVWYGGALSILIPLLVYLVCAIIQFKRLLKPIHIIGILVIISALSELIGHIVHPDNKIIYNLYYVVYFFLLTTFYSQLKFKSYKQTALIYTSYVIAGSIIVILSGDGLLKYQNFVWVMTSIITAGYGVNYIIDIQRQRILHEIPRYRSFFWINLGVLIFSVLSIIPLSLVQVFAQNRIDADIAFFIWNFQSVGNIIKNVMIAVGFYLSLRIS